MRMINRVSESKVLVMVKLHKLLRDYPIESPRKKEIPIKLKKL